MVLKKAVQGCLDWFHDLRYYFFLVLATYFYYFEMDGLGFIEFCLVYGCSILSSCLTWILLYGYVIIPNEPYVKFCNQPLATYPTGVGHHVRAFLSNETETWECPPKPGSTWVKQSIEKDLQCNETYCTADELASPESCYTAVYISKTGGKYVNPRDCDNWSADYPGCCVNADYDGTYVECEYCIPDKTELWAISTFAGIATIIPFFVLMFFSGQACLIKLTILLKHEREEREFRMEQRVEMARKAEEKAKKDAEEKAKKDAEAAEQGV